MYASLANVRMPNLIPWVLQVVWDDDEPSWVTHSDFEIYTCAQIPCTVAGLRLSQLIGTNIQVDWRDGFNFQKGQVTGMNRDHSFTITYDDGDVDQINLHNICNTNIVTSAYGRKHKVFEWCVTK